MPQPPLVAFDNVYDTITLYPGATLSSSSEIAGREVRRVADCRRERTWWQPSGDGAGNSPQGQWVIADVGATLTVNPNLIWLDRGHNLWGKTIIVERSTDGTSWTVTRTFTAPAITTTGGDPTTTTLVVSEEGALWGLVTGGVATRFHRVRVGFTAAYTPVITGLILGVHNQLTSYANRFDEDQGERTQRTETSDAGYRSTGRTYSWRRLDLSLSLIGATEYDATIRLLRQALFELNQPAFICMDYGTKPERSWLYQLDGTAWSFSKERVHRTGIIPMREVGHALENRIGVGSVPISSTFALQHTFTGADSTTTTGNADTGQAPTVYAGTAGRSSNKMYFVSPVNEVALAWDSTKSNGTFRAYITLSAVRGLFSLLFRGIDSNNWLLATLVKAGSADQIHLQKRDAGAGSVLATLDPAGLVLGSTYLLEVVASGADLTVKLDTVTKITHTLTGGEQTQYGTATMVGFRSYADGQYDDGGSRGDNLEVPT